MALAENLRAVLAHFPAVRLAVLSGSAARGTEHAGSDVDVGVLLDHETAELRLELEAELGRAAGRDLDLIFLDTAAPLLRFEIARDGVLLAARHRDDWVDFRTRAMLDWWDWEPTSRIITDAALRRLRENVGGPDGTP
jgi:predicted nucleotidyltransferase